MHMYTHNKMLPVINSEWWNYEQFSLFCTFLDYLILKMKIFHFYNVENNTIKPL